MRDTDWPYKVVIASDVAERDGIGLEVYFEDELILAVFRDDTKRTREFTLYQTEVPLTLIEESIEIFKREIPWDIDKKGT